MRITFWSSNLKFLRARRKISQDDLALKLGITRTKLASHEGGHTINPPIDDLIRFSDFYKLSIDVLLKSDLAKISAWSLHELEAGHDGYASGNEVRILATTVDSKNNENAELVPEKAKAGYTTGYGDPEFIAALPQFSLPTLRKDRKYRMFPISGDSMHPVPDGAFVIGEYVENWTAIKAATPCIVVTRAEGIVFKLVVPEPKKKALRLESLNEAYKPYEVTWNEVLEVWSFKGLLTESMPQPEATLQEIGKNVRDIKDFFKSWETTRKPLH